MAALLTSHLEFEDEHKKLLAAQVLLADSQREPDPLVEPHRLLW